MKDNQYIFSIVMAAYNTEKYVEEAISSVINQTFDFDKIQFIIIDDGSTDNTGNICRKYSEQYDNIIYVFQENTGQNIARNNGLKLVKGVYVNFLDSDDKLELNAFEEVYKFIMGHGEDVDVISIPRWRFEASSGPLPSHYRFYKTRVVDINKEYDCPQFAINSTFIKKSALTDEFDPRLVVSEDSMLVNKTIMHKMKYGVVNSTKYLYRKRFDETSTIDTKKKTKEYYIPYLKYYFKGLINYSIEKFDYVHRYVQFVLMFDLQWVLQISHIDALNKSDFEEFHNHLHEILQYIDDDIILSQRYLNNCYKYFVLTLKYKNPNFKTLVSSNNLSLDLNGTIIDNIKFRKITLNNLDLENNKLYMSGFFESCFKDIDIEITNNGNSLNLNKIDGECMYSLGKKVCHRIHFEVETELEKINELSFFIKYKKNKFEKNIMLGSKLKSKISKKLRLNTYNFYCSDDGIGIYYSKDLQLLKQDLIDVLEENELLDTELIEKSKKLKLFDDEYYLNQIENFNNEFNPFLHYIFNGYVDGINPSEKFDANYYKKSIDLNNKSNLNPLIYFIKYGLKTNEIQINPKIPNLKHVNKIVLDEKIKNFNKSGINMHKKVDKIIVSLTSFPGRMNDIHYCLYSLLNQSFKPDEIILWLSEDQFPQKEKNLPDNVLKLKNYGLTIGWYDNIFSYKKLIPALKKYSNDYIVTADDDIFYHENWLKNIYNGFKKHPDCIISSRSRKILLKNNEDLNYNEWKLINNNEKPSFFNFPTNGAGTLFSPDSLDKRIFKKEEFSKLCPTGDDIWIWGMAVLNNTKIYTIPENMNVLTYINPARDLNMFNEKTLFAQNKNRNNLQIKNLLEKYPEILEKLLNEKN